jgi:hypothetical protein
MTAPAAAELIIRVLTEDPPHVIVPTEERAHLLAAVAEYRTNCPFSPDPSLCLSRAVVQVRIAFDANVCIFDFSGTDPSRC